MPPRTSEDTLVRVLTEATDRQHATTAQLTQLRADLDRLIAVCDRLAAEVQALREWRIATEPHVQDVAAAKRTALGKLAQGLLLAALAGALMLAGGAAVPRLAAQLAPPAAPVVGGP